MTEVSSQAINTAEVPLEARYHEARRALFNATSSYILGRGSGYSITESQQDKLMSLAFVVQDLKVAATAIPQSDEYQSSQLKTNMKRDLAVSSDLPSLLAGTGDFDTVFWRDTSADWMNSISSSPNSIFAIAA